MTKYILRRLLQGIPLLLMISFIIFILLQASGDPLATLGGREPPRAEDKERLRRALGLDQPILNQYIFWLIGNDWAPIDFDGDGEPDPVEERQPREIRYGVLRGDFGDSITQRQPANEVIGERLPNTLLLMLSAEVVIVVVSLGVGIFAAIKQYSIWDNLLTGFSFLVYSMPIFWLGLMLMYIFSVQLDWFPAVWIRNPLQDITFWDVVRNMVLPVATIALVSIAAYSRYIRSAMLEVIQSDYIRTARAKGLHSRRVLFVHALKNASLPLVTLIGLDLPFLLAGAVVTEQIFSWPGMGRLFINSLERSDFPVLMGLLMLISVAVVLVQILIDILYVVIDPRIRYT